MKHFLPWLRSTIGQFSLRARLLLGLVLVAAIGLVVADFVVYGQIESYLNNQADQQLKAANPGRLTIFADGSVGSERVPPGTYVGVFKTDGSLAGSSDKQLSLQIPASYLANLAVKVQSQANIALPAFTTEGTGSGGVASGPYRVLATPVSLVTGPFGLGQAQPALEVVAVSLASLEGTLHQLIAVDVAVSAAVLALLGIAGFFVVRLGMRPLEAIEETAGAIAEGDLTRRVEHDDPKTEVGRLGASLNAMLSQIEESFARQQASEERLRQFLADASHELRTPVTSIRGYAELFRRGAANKPEDLALAMRRIEDESARMGVLVEDLLLLARLDQGRPLERNPVDLARLAIDVAADVQMLAPERSITADAPAPVIVSGDEQRLRQVISNLVQNAIRHTPPDATVDVRVRTSGKVAILEVEDTGPGIAEEHAAHVFERFYRADPSRTRESGGVGLGLAIVSSITQAHGGSARVATSPGRGAKFIVEFPLVPEAAASPGTEARPGRAGPVTEHVDPRPDEASSDARAERVSAEAWTEPTAGDPGVAERPRNAEGTFA